MTISRVDFASVANRMRNRARSGEYRGVNTVAEQQYLRHCSARIGNTTLIFTRDIEQHTSGWLSDPMHDRCWHLSISCNDSAERDAWLRAFFSDDLDKVWGMSSVSSFGEHRDVWHWRLFIDEQGRPVDVDEGCADLRAECMRPARELLAATRPLAA